MLARLRRSFRCRQPIRLLPHRATGGAGSVPAAARARAAWLPRSPIPSDQPPFVTMVFHAPFFTWYSVDIPLFSEPSFANEIRPVMPSKSIFFSAGR